MDNIAEQLVKKMPSAGESVKKTLTAAAAVIIDLICLYLCGAISPFLLILIVAVTYGAIYLIQSMYTEYEYTITNGELEIAKIAAKKKRTELLSVNVKDFYMIKKYSSGEDFNDDDLTRFHCSEGTINHLYLADFDHDEHGKCRLYFSPSNRILENIKPYLKPELQDNIVFYEDSNGSENEEEETENDE